MKRVLCCILLVAANKISLAQQAGSKKISNLVYGMVSGTALLMDAYVPARSNHKAILFIPGSAWGFPYPENYNQVSLKDDIILDSNYAGKWQRALLQNGYTVFVPDHRFAPKFQYQDIIEDCRRAVRYIRYHAADYQVDAGYIGAMGHSSGGNLAAMLGVSDSTYFSTRSPVDSVSSKVQAVVTLAAPFNLADINRPEDSLLNNNYLLSALTAYMGGLPAVKQGDFILSGKYSSASPFAQVTAGDAPVLICYSDNDPLIAVRQAKQMYEQLNRQNVPAKTIASHNSLHSPVPDTAEVINWFNKYLGPPYQN